ncbi:hypothetical protein ASA1KI_46010 [Opitutales bacterium ASA1]|uniref:class I SAM-dependent methyltransferase n=1 Tax=Congregicoccus parvus TaxID=3081749 RepID=UPI002B303C56|nr:hypothetical protein ASA1KI_46010 [Opitutales bacterium ASA1]
MNHADQFTPEDAVRTLRRDPAFADLIRDSYLDEDVLAAAARFGASGEWRAVRDLLDPWIRDASVVDLGAGNGMASLALLEAGARNVHAVEPDPSAEVGRGALARVCEGRAVRIVDAFGESLPLPDHCADIVYARQVLHHTTDLEQTIREVARVLRPGGAFLACREHVADTPEELRAFLAAHPVHRFTKGENAFPLARYRDAIAAAGLLLRREIGPWDSVVNLHPAVNDDDEIAALPERILREKFGPLAPLFARIPMVVARLRRPRPGRLYSFLAVKP